MCVEVWGWQQESVYVLVCLPVPVERGASTGDLILLENSSMLVLFLQHAAYKTFIVCTHSF